MGPAPYTEELFPVFKGRISLGDKGERLAAKFLKGKGYKIILTDYKTRLGQIDIIAEDKGCICFIEVKSRSSLKCGVGSESVLPRKQGQISKIALFFLKERNLLNARARFDVLSVDFSANVAKFDLIKDAFEARGVFTY